MRQFDRLLNQALLEYEYDSEEDRLQYAIKAEIAKAHHATTDKESEACMKRVEVLTKKLEKLKRMGDLYNSFSSPELDKEEPRKGIDWRKLAGRAKDAALAYLV